MKSIVRVYVKENGREVCKQKPAEIMKAIAGNDPDLDIDYLKENGHAKIGTLSELSGQTVKVGENTVEIK